MDARIQFRVSEETKRLAQSQATQQGTTLSDECRRLAESLAAERRRSEEHEDWLKKQVDAAFAKLDEGNATFLNESEAKSFMQDRKEAIRRKRGAL